MLRYVPDSPVVCYQSHENRVDHIGVSGKFKKRRGSAAGRLKTATFQVEYINFPEDNAARNAFQYAVEIWESELISPVPIRVRAEWTELEAGVLGQALWGSAYANFGGEQHMNTFYPVALAEKISARELNPASEPDIVASLNRKASWYFGTDGATPDGKMDLVTIALHELAHGLGFSDSYNVKDTEGSVGLLSGSLPVPFIFDVFVENEAGENLLHDFESPSTALGAAIQSTNVFFNGTLSVAALNGVKPELFAPSTFNKGSSISHLDEGAFNGVQDANRLMTPHIAAGESIHNPGSVLLATFNDMGWVHTKIDHQRLRDTERKDGQPYPVTALLASDSGYDPASVKLHYTTDGTNFTTLDMTPTGAPDEFHSALPGTTANRAYGYFISVADSDQRIFTNPGKIEASGKPPEQATHFFKIGPDVDGPEIMHEPVTYVFEHETGLEIKAEVTDNQGVKEVLVEYDFNDGAVQTAVMTPVSGTDEYSVRLALSDLVVGDMIGYRIVARDVAGIENFSFLPEAGNFAVAVTGIMAVQDSYINDFNRQDADFFGNSFRVTTPAVFEDGAIHSDHPYMNGTGPNDQSHYIFQLQVPIRINSGNPFIRFDEIVLVEPGENGSTFGSSGFYDYVVVEGSADGGVSWHPFADGYDSRDQDVWLSRYNATLSNDNSEAEGDPGLFRSRNINMLTGGDFSAGDEVLIRFRLFADQLAHGWGWAIDNLAIQGPITDLEEPLTAGIKVYPVPVVHQLMLEFPVNGGELVEVQIADVQGRILYDEQLTEAHPGRIEEVIDVQSLTGGIYVLKVKAGDRIHMRKFIKGD